MSNKRKQYSPQFKAKVALSALRGEKLRRGSKSVHFLLRVLPKMDTFCPYDGFKAFREYKA